MLLERHLLMLTCIQVQAICIWQMASIIVLLYIHICNKCTLLLNTFNTYVRVCVSVAHHSWVKQYRRVQRR